MKKTTALLGVLLLVATPPAVKAQYYADPYYYSINPKNTNTVTITGYTGSGGAVTIPTSISNLVVTSIGSEAFYFCTTVSSVIIPSNVTSIQDGAFWNCFALASVTLPVNVTNIGQSAFFDCYPLASVTIPAKVSSIGTSAFSGTGLARAFFQGNAPTTVGSSVFYNANSPTAYYLPGTPGWSNTFASSPSVPTKLWNPLIQASGASFGVKTNKFGFNITGTTNIPILVEACTNIETPAWSRLTNVLLTNGSFYFSDPQWTNYPARYYRIRSP